MFTIALALLTLYAVFGLLFYGMSSAARRADTLDARARAIAKQNLRRRTAAMASARTSVMPASLTIV